MRLTVRGWFFNKIYILATLRQDVTISLKYIQMKKSIFWVSSSLLEIL